MVKPHKKNGAALPSGTGGGAARDKPRAKRPRSSRFGNLTPEAKARRKLKYSKSGHSRAAPDGERAAPLPPVHPGHHGGDSSSGGGARSSSGGGARSSSGGGAHSSSGGGARSSSGGGAGGSSGGGASGSSGGGAGGSGGGGAGGSARVSKKSERLEVLDAAKQLWEQLRLASSRGGSRRDAEAVAKERATASALVTKLLGMLAGRLQEFSLRHDGSRIIQWLLKRGTKAQRGVVAAELLAPPSAAALSVAAGRLAMAAGRGGGGGGGDTSGSFTALPFVHTLLNDRYGTHLVVQLLRYGDTATRRTVGEALRGHVSQRLRNPYAASAIDFGFQVVWPASLKRGLVLELLFAKQLRLLDAATKAAVAAAAKGTAGAAAVTADAVSVEQDVAAAEAAARENKVGPKTGRKQSKDTAVDGGTAAAAPSVETFDSFSDALAHLDPIFRSAVVTSAAETLTSMAEKPEMLKRALVHAAIAQWFDVAMPVPEYAAFVTDLASTLAPHLVELAFTRPGATAAVHVVRLLDARGRKRVLRAIKPHISDLAGDECGHMVLLAVYAAVDDTKLVAKSVTTVLLTPLPEGDAPPVSRAKAAAAAATEAADRDMDVGDDDEGEGAMDTSAADADGDGAMDDRDDDDGDSDVDGGDEIGDDPRTAREQAALLVLIRSRFPRLVLLHILFPAETRYFHPSVYAPVWADTPAHFGILSRKDPAVRRREVLTPFLTPLSAIMQRYAGVLLADSGSAPIVLGAAVLDATRSVTLEAVGAALAAPDPDNDGACGEGAADGLAAFLASRPARRCLRALLTLVGPAGVNAVVAAMGVGGATRVADAARPLDPPVDGGVAMVMTVLERGRGGGDAVLAVARAARAALLATAKGIVKAHKSL
ncbi:hypothetical protein MMPV_002973 [Pyropia vietnamensis]